MARDEPSDMKEKVIGNKEFQKRQCQGVKSIILINFGIYWFIVEDWNTLAEELNMKEEF